MSETQLAYTINEFCAAVRISRGTFYALPESERPREMRVGVKRILISRTAAEEWVASREKRGQFAAA